MNRGLLIVFLGLAFGGSVEAQTTNIGKHVFRGPVVYSSSTNSTLTNAGVLAASSTTILWLDSAEANLTITNSLTAPSIDGQYLILASAYSNQIHFESNATYNAQGGTGSVLSVWDRLELMGRVDGSHTQWFFHSKTTY